MASVYLVIGDNGMEYEDYSEWIICAYPGRGMALKHAQLAKAHTAKAGNPYDESVYGTYAKTSYRVDRIKLMDNPKQYRNS